MLQFFFPAVCVLSIEHSLNLAFFLTSGTCGTAVLTTPLKVVEAPRTSIRLISLLSSLAVRWKLVVLHNASAWAQKSATRIPKWKDLGPLRLPRPRTASGAPQRVVQKTPVLHAGRILRLGDRRADGDVHRVGCSARDERSDNSCWGKLLVLAPRESEESCL